MYFLDWLVVGCGLYILYHTYIMKRDGVIPQGVMINKGVIIPKDADVKGFILDMFGKGIVFGVSACVSGILGVISNNISQIRLVAAVFSVVFFVILVVFVVFLKKAHRKYLHIN